MYATRSLLYVPAANREWVQKTPYETAADGIIFDLEDGTHPSKKDDARGFVRDFLNEADSLDIVLTVRVNAPETGFFEDDIADVAHPNLDAFVLPKADSEEYVTYADNVLTFVERRKKISDEIDLFLLPESAYGLYNPYELCAASDRVASITGGTTRDGDFNRALNYEFTEQGLESLYARSNVLAGAKAAGLEQVLSGLWTDIEDTDGLRKHARFGRQLGFTGYEVIHPDHAEIVNEIFTPDEAEIRELQEMVNELEDAFDEGSGVIRWNGEMVDTAHFKTVKQKLERAKRFGVID